MWLRADSRAEPRQAAVVDIGSNSVRLVIYKLDGRAIWTVYNEKSLAGLGRDLPADGAQVRRRLAAARVFHRDQRPRRRVQLAGQDAAFDDVTSAALIPRTARARAILLQIGAEASDRVFGPIGLDLGAEGPEQIAISVLAEDSPYFTVNFFDWNGAARLIEGASSTTDSASLAVSVVTLPIEDCDWITIASYSPRLFEICPTLVDMVVRLL